MRKFYATLRSISVFLLSRAF